MSVLFPFLFCCILQVGSIWSICENATYPFLQAIPNPQPDVPIAVTINQGSTQTDPVGALPIVFDVVFAAPVTGFDNTDVDFSAGTATVTDYTVTDTGDSMSYTVEVTTVGGDLLFQAGNSVHGRSGIGAHQHL